MAYLFSLYRHHGEAITPAELRGAVGQLPYFHPHGPSAYVCDIPQRRLWLELSADPDGSVSVHVPQRVYDQNAAMVNDLCRRLAAQLNAGVFDHQTECDLPPGEWPAPSPLDEQERALPAPAMGAPLWTRPLELLLLALAVALALGLLALITMLAAGILAAVR